MKKAIALALISGCIISGCATTSMSTVTSKSINDYNTPYYDADGQLKSLRFGKYAHIIGKELKENDVAGYFQDLSTGKEIKIFKYSDEKTFSLINLDTDQPITVLNPASFHDIANAKNVKFHEFGKGIIESAIFMSANGLCKDYNSSKGINVDFVTNYYPNYYKSPNDFMTTFANVQLYQQEPNKLISSKVEAHSNNEKIKQQLLASAQKDKSKLLQADAGKLGSFVKYLCDK